jgi:sterol desaturase/sphingolipid hydroxylase (fatty acid hydroxylase superfamily)
LNQSQERPFGVTIIAVLAIIDGVLLVFGGLSFLAFGTFFATVPIENIVINQQQQSELQLQQQQQQQQLQEVQNAAELQALTQFFASIGIVIGGIVLAVGIGYLVVSYGLLKGKGWAWTITVVLSIIAIIVQIISAITTANALLSYDINASWAGIISHIIGIAINGVIIYYLFRSHVKAFFGKTKPSTTIQT